MPLGVPFGRFRTLLSDIRIRRFQDAQTEMLDATQPLAQQQLAAFAQSPIPQLAQALGPQPVAAPAPLPQPTPPRFDNLQQLQNLAESPIFGPQQPPGPTPQQSFRALGQATLPSLIEPPPRQDHLLTNLPGSLGRGVSQNEEVREEVAAQGSASEYAIAQGPDTATAMVRVLEVNNLTAEAYDALSSEDRIFAIGQLSQLPAHEARASQSGINALLFRERPTKIRPLQALINVDRAGVEVGAAGITGARIAAEELIPGGGRPSLEAVREGGLGGAIERSEDVGFNIPERVPVVGGARVRVAEIVNPINAIPLPVFDAAVAKLLAIPLRFLGKGATMPAAALRRLSTKAADKALDESLDDAMRATLRQFSRETDEAVARASVLTGAEQAEVRGLTGAPDAAAELPTGLPSTADVAAPTGAAPARVVPEAGGAAPLSEVRTGQPFTARLYRGETSGLRPRERGTFLTPDRQTASGFAVDEPSAPLTQAERRKLTFLTEKDSERKLAGREGLFGSEEDLFRELQLRSRPLSPTTAGARVSFGNESFSNPIVFGSKKDTESLLPESVEIVRRDAGEVGLDEMLASAARDRGHDAIVYTRGEKGAGVVVDLRLAPVPARAAEPGAQAAVPSQEGRVQALGEERPVGGGEARSPTGVALPNRSTSGARQAIALKEETLLRPGKVTQLPGIKQAISGLNPSVSIDRKVLVGYNARQSVTATLSTEFAATRLEVTRALQSAWDVSPPRYTGPADNPFKNTVKDWADNPEFYTGVTEDLRAAAGAYDDVSNQILARTRGEFGVDINAFSSEKSGSFYLATVPAREALDDSLVKVGEGYASSSISARSGRARARVYEGAYQRNQRNPDFNAVTELDELTDLHDQALATMAGNETFRTGVGGRTRLEVMKELHPQLYDRMIKTRRTLSNLRGTVSRLDEKLSREIDDFLLDPNVEISDLTDALDVTVKRGRLKGANVKTVNAEIQRVRQELRNLRPAWESANLEPFVLNRKTFRYHEAEQSAAIDKILLQKLPLGDGLVAAIDEVRLVAFTADISPMTIQGLLGFLSNPVTGTKAMPAALRSLMSPESLIEYAARNPGEIARYTQATGRPFGQLGTEFVQRARGIERVPGGRQLNDRLMAFVETIRQRQWKTDTALVQNLGGATQNVADAEAANALSKIIPALNPAERGASILQSRLERVPVISTSFIGGPATVVKDAASGLAKITLSRTLSPAARWQALSGREQLAIIHLSSIAGTIASLSVGSHILSGWSPEEAVKVTLDPNSGRFLSLALGGERHIPLGGPLRSTARAFVPQQVGEVKGLPVYAPFKGVPNWLRGKVTPAISAPVNLARNEDYFGAPIATGGFLESTLRMIWFGANSVLPLPASAPSEALRRGEVSIDEPGRLAERFGAQLAGIDFRETSPFERLQRHVSEQRPGIDTPDELVTSLARDMANRGDERVAQLVQDFERSGSVFNTPGARRRNEQAVERAARVEETGLRDLVSAALGGNLEKSAQAARQYDDLRRDLAIIGQAAGRGKFPDPSSEMGKLRAEYYAISPFDPIFVDSETGAPDFGAFRVAQRAVLNEIRKTDPGLASSMDQQPLFNPDDDPELAQWERGYLSGKKIEDELREISPVRGLSATQFGEIRSFYRDVNRALDETAGAFPDREVSFTSAIQQVGQQQSRSESFIKWAVAVRSNSKTREQLTNPEFERFIFEHRAELEPFFPELFTRERLRDFGRIETGVR